MQNTKLITPVMGAWSSNTWFIDVYKSATVFTEITDASVKFEQMKFIFIIFYTQNCCLILI